MELKGWQHQGRLINHLAAARGFGEGHLCQRSTCSEPARDEDRRLIAFTQLLIKLRPKGQ